MSDAKLHIGRPSAWIAVTGEDSFSFLQGQFTNDLRSSASAPSTYGLWLDRKGKVIADSFILQESEDHFYLYSYHSPAAAIIQRLEPYIIADDVILTDLTDSAVAVSLWGSNLEQVLTNAGFNQPDQGCFFQQGENFLFRGRRSQSPNVEWVLKEDDPEATIAAISGAVIDAGGERVDEHSVEKERIKACIASVPHDVGPTDLPQEGNLEQEAISYTKGCYLGQEVMARIRSMGQVRRTLVQVQLTDETAQPPAPLYDGAREVGSLRSEAGSLGLALIRIDFLKERRALSLRPEDTRPTIQISGVPNQR